MTNSELRRLVMSLAGHVNKADAILTRIREADNPLANEVYQLLADEEGMVLSFDFTEVAEMLNIKRRQSKVMEIGS